MTTIYRARLREQLRTASTVSASEAKNQFGRVLESALSEGAVVITKHDVPKAILLSMKEYEAMATKHAASRPGSKAAERPLPRTRPQRTKQRSTLGMFPDFEAPSLDEFKTARRELSKHLFASVRRR